MDNPDLDVLRSSVQWLKAGHRVTLVTVTKTWGSSPRPVGSMLSLRGDGALSGSVSGGCIEDDLIARNCQDALTTGLPTVVTYGISADEAHRFGLPCGGTMELVVEPVSEASLLVEMLEHLENGTLIRRQLDMLTGSVSLAFASPGDALRFDRTHLVTIHGPRYRLLIIGAGQLSQFLAEVARGLDYHVTVCDPRTEYADVWTVASVAVRRTMPDDFVIDMKLDSRTAIVAVTHDPKLDDLALMEALRTEAFYVGAIGSRLNHEKRRERLREFDVTDEQIARLRGPVGLYIGSQTPSEIGISILAELTAAKNHVVVPALMRVDVAKNLAGAMR